MGLKDQTIAFSGGGHMTEIIVLPGVVGDVVEELRQIGFPENKVIITLAFNPQTCFFSFDTVCAVRRALKIRHNREAKNVIQNTIKTPRAIASCTAC